MINNLIKRIKFYISAFIEAFKESNKLTEDQKKWYRANNTIYNNAKFLKRDE